jgi:hypothetical protein
MSKTIISPKGIAVYPRLNKPDTKYDANGVYKAPLKLDTDDEDAAEFCNLLDGLCEEAYVQAVQKAVEAGEYKSEAVAMKRIKRADPPYTVIEDEDGEETSFIKVNFKMKARIKSRKTGEEFDLKPKIFDAHKQEMPKCPAVYSGSTIRVAFRPVFWYTKQLGAGVKLQLEAVQIIDLVQGSGGGDADSYGFGDEDGYSYEAPSDAPFGDAEDPGTTDDGSGDF